eukprot:TRINITY_DN90987_c0_g1_i1.p1 TRINITY_DN90987_c0_g1~~TRINITY_DN90987_c0_g1_i1.p1  ORF type:complete len:557 (-),score=94.30 TRINITY_DN90987_c0_g1_i1:139-1809(-)
MASAGPVPRFPAPAKSASTHAPVPGLATADVQGIAAAVNAAYSVHVGAGVNAFHHNAGAVAAAAAVPSTAVLNAAGRNWSLPATPPTQTACNVRPAFPAAATQAGGIGYPHACKPPMAGMALASTASASASSSCPVAAAGSGIARAAPCTVNLWAAGGGANSKMLLCGQSTAAPHNAYPSSLPAAAIASLTGSSCAVTAAAAPVATLPLSPGIVAQSGGGSSVAARPGHHAVSIYAAPYLSSALPSPSALPTGAASAVAGGTAAHGSSCTAAGPAAESSAEATRTSDSTKTNLKYVSDPNMEFLLPTCVAAAVGMPSDAKNGERILVPKAWRQLLTMTRDAKTSADGNAQAAATCFCPAEPAWPTAEQPQGSRVSVCRGIPMMPGAHDNAIPADFQGTFADFLRQRTEEVRDWQRNAHWKAYKAREEREAFLIRRETEMHRAEFNKRMEVAARVADDILKAFQIACLQKVYAGLEDIEWYCEMDQHILRRLGEDVRFLDGAHLQYEVKKKLVDMGFSMPFTYVFWDTERPSCLRIQVSWEGNPVEEVLETFGVEVF